MVKFTVYGEVGASFTASLFSICLMCINVSKHQVVSTYIFIENVQTSQSIVGRHLHTEGVPRLTFGVLSQLFKQSRHGHTAKENTVYVVVMCAQ